MASEDTLPSADTLPLCPEAGEGSGLAVAGSVGSGLAVAAGSVGSGLAAAAGETVGAGVSGAAGYVLPPGLGTPPSWAARLYFDDTSK